MKSFILLFFISLSTRGCESTLQPSPCDPGSICLTVDKPAYSLNDTIRVILQNHGEAPVFLPGCSPLEIATQTDTGWAEAPLVVCVWEGVVLKIPAGGFYQEKIAARAYPGLHKFVAAIHLGCTEGQPLSTANCSRREKIYSAEFSVRH